MKKKTIVIIAIALVMLLGAGFAAYRTIIENTRPLETAGEPEEQQVLPQVDDSVSVDVKRSRTEANTIVLSVSGLDGKMAALGYELTYESQGLIKGVNSGKPLDVSGKDSFERDIYMGTCSRNVCKPDNGVTKVSLALEFTDTQGKKFQFIGDFDIAE